MPNRRQIIKNCASSSGYNGEGVINISAERLTDLMIGMSNQHGDLGRTIRELLRAMEAGAWRISAGIHAGGIGGGGRGADPRNHITLNVAQRNHHLRFGGSARQPKLVEITG